jgi:hypothetical protein
VFDEKLNGEGKDGLLWFPPFLTTNLILIGGQDYIYSKLTSATDVRCNNYKCWSNLSEYLFILRRLVFHALTPFLPLFYCLHTVLISLNATRTIIIPALLNYTNNAIC